MSYKTHSIRVLPCGCKEIRYLFGREILRRPTCWHDHGQGPKMWPAPNQEGEQG
jgi:hypothetical protein